MPILEAIRAFYSNSSLIEVFGYHSVEFGLRDNGKFYRLGTVELSPPQELQLNYQQHNRGSCFDVGLGYRFYKVTGNLEIDDEEEGEKITFNNCRNIHNYSGVCDQGPAAWASSKRSLRPAPGDWL